MFFFSCLPQYNPDLTSIMSRSAYASSLKNLEGAQRTKSSNSAGGSGSVVNHENEAESITLAAAVGFVRRPVDAAVDVCVQDVPEPTTRRPVKMTKT